MPCEACVFETERLRIHEWHSPSGGERDLAAVVAGLLTEQVTRSLPSGWQGSYSEERARAWIKDRESEGTTLLVADRSNGEPIGLMILSETQSERDVDRVDIRLGYLLADDVWGKGYASELIKGFVSWCREQKVIHSLAGGVEPGNPASARVLERNGFQAVPPEGHMARQHRLFHLTLQP